MMPGIVQLCVVRHRSLQKRRNIPVFAPDHIDIEPGMRTAEVLGHIRSTEVR